MIRIAIAALAVISITAILFLLTAQNHNTLFQKCNCVAFRLDDVQDYFHDKTQLAIMQQFDSQGAKLTLGVIAASIGNDTKVVALARNGNFELANHGLHHEDFTTFSLSQQIALLQSSQHAIQNVFGRTPTVFIPPYDLFDNATLLAMKQNNLNTISAVYWSDSARYEQAISHAPANVEFSDFTNNQWVEINTEHIQKDIDYAVKNNGYAVVGMHPNEFDGNPDKLQQVISHVREQHFRIVFISEVGQYIDNTVTLSTFPKFPH